VCELLFAFLVFWSCQALWSYIFWFLSSIPFSSLWNIQHWHHLNKFLFINIRVATISNVMIQCPVQVKMGKDIYFPIMGKLMHSHWYNSYFIKWLWFNTGNHLLTLLKFVTQPYIDYTVSLPITWNIAV
jgi:hypothetical protein